MKHFKSNYLTVLLLVACLGLLAAQSAGAATTYAQHTITSTQAQNLLNWLKQQEGPDAPQWLGTAIAYMQSVVCEAEPCPDSYTLWLSPTEKTIAMTGAATGKIGRAHV